MFKKIEVNYDLLRKYLTYNKDKPIYVVYHELKNKKFKDMTNEEKIVFAYLRLNRKKLGIK